MNDADDREDNVEGQAGESEEQQAQSQYRTGYFTEQADSGVDLSLLRANLRLTPTERFQKHQKSLRLLREVRRAAGFS